MNQRWRHFRRHCLRYSAATDWLDAALLLLTGILAYNTVSVSGWVATFATAVYVVILVLKLSWTIRQRRANDRLQGQILWGLFDLLNKQFFKGDSHLRFTLFRQDPIDERFIIPWYRYERGSGEHPISAAVKSKARYRREEGCTGQAWVVSGNNKFQITRLPEFAGRADFLHFYQTDMKVTEENSLRISPYMEKVQAILSCGITDTRSSFLGVLSIDLQWKWVTVDPPTFATPSGTQIAITTECLATIVTLVHNVLRSISQAQDGK